MKFFYLLLISWSPILFAKNYMVLLSYDNWWLPGVSPHTFAYFYSSDDSKKFTISWLPRSSPGDVSIFGQAVNGKNYSLQETLDYADKNQKRLFWGGEYEINNELMLQAEKQFKKLNSGKVKYKVLGVSRSNEEEAYHCIYAISDAIKKPKLMKNGLSYGSDSMRRLVSYFHDYILAKIPENSSLFKIAKNQIQLRER